MSGSWTIHTGDGSVDLTLPDSFQANLDAHTNDGRISLGFPVTVDGIISKSEVRGKINVPAQADEARQEERRAGVAGEPDANERGAEVRVRRREPDVARERQPAAGARRDAI